MITVIFDLLFAQPQGGAQFHGGGEYIKSVFEAIVKQYNGTFQLEVCFDKDSFLDDWVLNVLKEKQIRCHQVKSACDIVDVLNRAVGVGPVRFFAGMIYPYDRYAFPKGVVSIGTCHGLRLIEKPYDTAAIQYMGTIGDIKEFIKYVCFRKRYMRNVRGMYSSALSRFDIVITDSVHSAYSITVSFPELAQSKRILVFYAPSKYMESHIEKAGRTKEPYILMVSANRWVKNSYRGVIALDGLYQKGFLKGIKTRVYGKLPEGIQKKLKCRGNFEFYGYVSTEELEEAYRSCEVFFYPTLNEGFGLPPLEAMKYGKTCVISAVCSLMEVYGNSVYYCNPYDIMEIQNRILQAVDRNVSAEVIKEHMDRIKDKQNHDLRELCKLIMT